MQFSSPCKPSKSTKLLGGKNVNEHVHSLWSFEFLFDLRRLITHVLWPMSDAWCLKSDVQCLTFDVPCPMSEIRCLMFDVWFLITMFDVRSLSCHKQLIYFNAFFVAKVWLTKEYSLTSTYGHLYNTDASVKRTLGSFPLVSILKDVWLYNIGKQHRYEDVIFDKIHQTLDIEHHPSDIRQQTWDIRH